MHLVPPIGQAVLTIKRNTLHYHIGHLSLFGYVFLGSYCFKIYLFLTVFGFKLIMSNDCLQSLGCMRSVNQAERKM